jgi:hypothetical protein
VNALCFVFFALALAQKTASVSFLDLDGPDRRYTAAALIVSIPEGSGSVNFGPAEVALHRGGAAAFQASVVAGRKQANWYVNALYDHAVIAVENTGYGIVIRALQEGETTLQTLTEEGIKDVLIVRVEP